ncbi:hypothetical protein DMA11_23975 [Marinilabiliaceae bacterium JC017]|nr:hypothetical protein DMA11_23975 [Marinilabiliaceae bacterium JC017]
MKHLSIIYSLILVLCLASCSKDDIITDTEYGQMSFAITSKTIGSTPTLKSASTFSGVTHAIISIHKGGKTFLDYDLKKIKMSDWGGGTLVSDDIKLWVGNDYELVRFELQDKNNKTLYAAPLKGSDLADKVSKPLAISFSIEKDKSSPVGVEVLSTETASPADFGFVQFNVKVSGAATSNMVLVEGGTYDLSVGLKKKGKDDIEAIHYKVTLDDFYICQYEVTQAQWFDIMGTKPQGFVGGNMPANNISKAEALEFIKKLNAKTGETYRLPTEAEWIYAARGGNKTKGYTYAGSNELDQVAWHKNNSGMKVHPVGQKLANELGLYDMTGNVWEWCGDTYDHTGRLAYDDLNVNNPKNEKGDLIVSRGGAFNLEEQGYFSINLLNHPFWHGTNRDVNHAEAKFATIGFRLVKSK